MDPAPDHPEPDQEQQEREFYLLAAIKERWSKRELERQIATGTVLRGDTRTKKVSPAVSQIHPTAIDELKNAYSLEFLSLPGDHNEEDLHSALLRNLGRFITELGRDFCFVGSEYPVQVGNQDFAIDLYHWAARQRLRLLSGSDLAAVTIERPSTQPGPARQAAAPRGQRARAR